jgi:glycosyltransferase involved in cell wall biosynthesis
MDDITALILTYNEKENIGRTLESLTWVPRVIIIDSHSTDETLRLARNYPNVSVLQRAFDSHPNQWNFGLEKVETPWVLTLDADYRLSDRLVAEIQNLNPGENIAGYEAQFEYQIGGRSLRASVYPPRVVLFRLNQGKYVDDGHTQLLSIDASKGPRPSNAKARIERFSGKIYHDDRKPLTRWLQEQDRYARLEARHLLSIPVGQLSFQDRLRRTTFFAAPAMFSYLLFARGLMFDGWRGWYYVAQRTIAEFLLSIRLLEARLEIRK